MKEPKNYNFDYVKEIYGKEPMKRFNPYRFMRIGDHVVENIYEPEYFEDEETEILEDDDEQF